MIQRLTKTFGTLQKWNVRIIEDCTHIAHPIPKSQPTASFRLYSLHKHYPTPEGAILVDCDGRQVCEDALEIFLNDGPRTRHWNDKIRLCLWIFKRVAQSFGLLVRHPSFDSTLQQSAQMNPKRMSSFVSVKSFAQRIIVLENQRQTDVTIRNDIVALSWCFLVKLICGPQGIKFKVFAKGNSYLTGFIFSVHVKCER